MAKEKDYYIKKIQMVKISNHDMVSLSELVGSTEIQDGPVHVSPDVLRNMYYSNEQNGLYRSFLPKPNKGSKYPHILMMDIISPKVKVLLSFEQKRPFLDKLAAVNKEATTRREQEEFKKISDYTISEIMRPIETMYMAQAMQSLQGQQLDKDQLAQVQQQVAEATKKMTPPEVKKYMATEHQDIADIAGNQVLEYLKKHKKIKFEYDKGLLEAAISSIECFKISIRNKIPTPELIYGENISYLKSTRSEFIEDADFIKVRHKWTYETLISEVINLEDSDKESIKNYIENKDPNWETYLLDVDHYMWRTMKDAKAVTSEMGYILVPDDYQKSEDQEVIDIEIPCIEQCYIIDRETPLLFGEGEYMSFNGEDELKMPYYGTKYDDWFMKRLYNYQLLYDILVYNFTRLLGKNKGKKTFINPKGLNGKSIDFEKFLKYFEDNDIGWLEGMGNDGSIINLVKEIDMSHNVDLQVIQKFLEYIDIRAGMSVGIPKQLEAQISEREGVKNVGKIFEQTLNLLEPYYQLHDQVKNRLTIGLIDTARMIWKDDPPANLYYLMDDQTINFLKFDYSTFTISRYGLFMNSTSKIIDDKGKIDSFLQLYVQNPNAKLSHIIKIAITENPVDALTAVRAEENYIDEIIAEKEDMAHNRAMELEKLRAENEMKLSAQRIKEDRAKEIERRITEVAKAAIIAGGFDKEKDYNNNNIPDVIEQSKLAIKQAELALKEQKLDVDKYDSETKRMVAEKK